MEANFINVKNALENLKSYTDHAARSDITIGNDFLLLHTPCHRKIEIRPSEQVLEWEFYSLSLKQMHLQIMKNAICIAEAQLKKCAKDESQTALEILNLATDSGI